MHFAFLTTQHCEFTLKKVAAILRPVAKKINNIAWVFC